MPIPSTNFKCADVYKRQELRNVVNITTLSMTDKERMDVVERCHSKMKRYRNLCLLYTSPVDMYRLRRGIVLPPCMADLRAERPVR